MNDSTRRAPLAAMFVAALCMAAPRLVAAQPEDLGATESTPGAAASRPEPAPGPVVQTLGESDQKLFVVDHGDSWSMHAESLVTDQLLRLWHEAGGPEVLAKTVVDRVYTISVHKLSPERIFERLLDGYDYTLHYDAGGRLERVRVYSVDPSAVSVFKTPRLVESLATWREAETAAPAPTGDEPAVEAPSPASPD